MVSRAADAACEGGSTGTTACAENRVATASSIARTWSPRSEGCPPIRGAAWTNDRIALSIEESNCVLEGDPEGEIAPRTGLQID